MTLKMLIYSNEYSRVCSCVNFRLGLNSVQYEWYYTSLDFDERWVDSLQLYSERQYEKWKGILLLSSNETAVHILHRKLIV